MYAPPRQSVTHIIQFEIENNVCQCQVHYVYENYLKTNTANKRNANTGATNQTIGRGKTHAHTLTHTTLLRMIESYQKHMYISQTDLSSQAWRRTNAQIVSRNIRISC